MEPIIKEENKIYAIGYSYATDWPKLCRTVDRAAYWSVTDFSNITIAKIKNLHKGDWNNGIRIRDQKTNL